MVTRVGRDNWMMRRFLRQERGSELVEFALVAILLLVQLFGIMEFGRAIWMYGTLAHAAREGARYAIVRGSESGDARGASWEAVASDVQAHVRSVATGFGSSVTVTTTWDPDGDSGCTPDNKPGCVVQVKAQAPFNAVTPFVGSMALSATSRMVISY